MGITMKVRVVTVHSVKPLGENLSIVRVVFPIDAHEGLEARGIEFKDVVANRREDGSFRWAEGETCVYVPEGAIVPDDVLKERGYWDEEKGKGLLEGKKGNRVKMRRFAGFESRGLLFKVQRANTGMTAEYAEQITRGNQALRVTEGDDVAEFLGITEHVAA